MSALAEGEEEEGALTQAVAQQRAAAEVRRWSASASVVSWVVAIAPVRYSVCSLYWYKSANTDTLGAAVRCSVYSLY
jgi:hypothetical protein